MITLRSGRPQKIGNHMKEYLEKVKPYIEEGFVSVQYHPEDENLAIFNYSNKCQWEQKWDEITMMSRGLIINIKTGERLSNPLPKFFNYEEAINKGLEIPREAPVVTKKYDGWLGISYWLNGSPRISTRGSFASPGALWATDWLGKNIPKEAIPKDKTLLFEIIHPITKIVCNYDFEGLVHFATREIETGKEDRSFSVHERFKRAEEIPFNDITALKAMEEKNQEGFVIFYPEVNSRLKIKFDEYKRLHKIMTGVSEIGVWEFLRDNRSLDPLLEKVPDEFYQWVNRVVDDLKRKYMEIEKESGYVLGNLHPGMPRKEQAEVIKKGKYPGVSFSMLDGKDYSQVIYKMIRPHGQSSFKNDEL